MIGDVNIPAAEMMPRPRWIQWGIRNYDGEGKYDFNTPYRYFFLRLPIWRHTEDIVWGPTSSSGGPEPVTERLCILVFKGRSTFGGVPWPFYWERQLQNPRVTLRS